MKILILEDAPERIRTFQKQLKDHDVYFFDDVADAIAAVEFIGDFDMYFIDHDLDNQVFVDSHESNTGYQFAKHLSKKELSDSIDIIIHSMNPVGAQNIKSVLPQSKIIPFPSLFST